MGIVIFVVVSQISQSNSDTLRKLIGQTGLLGVFSYIGILVLSIVFAPLGTGFLLPIAANTWGPFIASIYSIIGWTIGAMIAFFLARKYGLKLVKNVKIITRLRNIERAIPRSKMFVTVVLLRVALPVDILSYALGIFGSMSYSSYFLATILGISPFTFIFMYAATLTITIQISVAIFGALIFLSGVYFVFSRSKKAQKVVDNNQE